MDSINVMFPDESFEFKSILISGRVNNPDETPTSAYGGPLDLDEIHTCLFYANRAIIKLLTEEFEIPLETVDEFLFSAISEALTKEWNAQAKGLPDMDVRKVVRHRKNQN